MRHSPAKHQERRCLRFLRRNHRRSRVTSRTLPLSFRRLSAKSCAKIARNGIRSPTALVLVLLVTGLALALPFYWHRNLTPSAPPEKSIAVLPFLDLSETKDQEYFCDGMSEEILDALAKVDGLRVVA